MLPGLKQNIGGGHTDNRKMETVETRWLITQNTG
jgi:hypothetical protein